MTPQNDIFKSNSLENISHIFKRHNAKIILLVTGKKSYVQSGAREALAPYLNGVSVIRFSDFEPNPRLEDAYKGINLLKESKPDLILTIGGGSVIDMGKLIGILAAQEEQNKGDIILNNTLIKRKGIPLIAIPTTSGTGSEATHFSVVYIDSKKYSLASPFMLPDYALLEPRLTTNIPKKLAATSSFDALAQAIESYWAVSSSNESRDFAKQAIELIFPVIVEFVNCPSVKSRRDMMLGSHLAGKAINLSKTTAPHAISYTLTSYFGIPHGHAVGLSLGKILVLNSHNAKAKINDLRGRTFVNSRIKEIVNIFGVDTAEECGQKLYVLMDDIGLERNLSDMNLNSKENIELIINNINIERMANNPIQLSLKDIESIW